MSDLQPNQGRNDKAKKRPRYGATYRGQHPNRCSAKRRYKGAVYLPIFINHPNTAPMQNRFNELFKQHTHGHDLGRFADKFTPKPYGVTHKPLYMIATVCSFICHTAAALAAGYFFVNLITDLVGRTAAIVAALVLVCGIEAAKRATAERVAVAYLMYKTVGVLAVFSLALAAGSTAAAYYGTETAVIDAHGEFEATSSKDLTAPHYATIKAAQVSIEAAKGMKNYQGNTSLKGQRVIDNATKTIEAAQARINVIEARTEAKNDTGEQLHTATATGKGSTFAVIMLLLEVLLLVCIYYANYYEFRTTTEGKAIANTSTEAIPATIQTEPAKKSNVRTYTRPNRSTATGRTQPHGIGFRMQNDTNVGTSKESPAHANDTSVQPNDTPANDTNDTSPTIIVQPNDTPANGRACLHCSQTFAPNAAKQKYCNDTCRAAAWTAKNGRKPHRLNSK